MKLPHLLSVLGIVTSTMMLGNLAAAQPTPEANAPTRAQTLHDEGRALMKQGDHREAYDKFLESLVLRDNMSTRFRFAQAAEKLGKLATASDNYQRVARDSLAAQQLDRAKFAQNAADKLKPRLSRLSIAVNKHSQAIAGLAITLTGSDGKQHSVHSTAWGKATPIDGDSYTLHVSAPGYVAWSQKVLLRNEGHLEHVVVPMLKPSVHVQVKPKKPPSNDGAEGPAASLPKKEPLSDPLIANNDAGRGNGSSIAGIVTTFAGVGIGGAGLAFAIIGENHYDESSAYCSPTNFCEPQGLDLRKQGRTEAILGAVLEVTGLMTTGVGLALWVSAASGDGEEAPTTEVSLRVTGNGALLRVGW